MWTNPLISILIVAYNPGKYLRNTLRSCLDQTYENTEILILDNASSEDIQSDIILWFDGILEKTEWNEYQIIHINTESKKQKTVRLIRSKENLGPYWGLNLLLGEAQWEYIAIQDHDDIWKAEKLEKQLNFLLLNPNYIGCGTKTVMYYEWDGKYFEYSLWKENYYTVHPSLLFRYDGTFRYDTFKTEYMCDAYSLRYNLCHGKKKIANLDEPLTLHLIKKWSTNYSYKWHRLTWANIRRVYSVHSVVYATLTLGWELKRKIVYPILQFFWLGNMVDTIERIPFRLFGNNIKTTQWDEWWRKYL